jgi:hypothetical protein
LISSIISSDKRLPVLSNLEGDRPGLSRLMILS